MHGKQNSHGQMQDNNVAQCTAEVSTDAYATLSAEAITSLRYMIEEEKLAGDLYEAFAEQTGLVVFDRIAAAEDRHLESLIAQAENAGIAIDDLTALPSGEYADPTLQALYAELLAAGSASTDAALAVGREVELVDIADLTTAMAAVADTPLVGVYSHLQVASGHHLAAFDNWLTA
jgi:hypothetical protein